MGNGSASSNGIPGQSIKVRGLWYGVRVYSWRTVVFPRQAIQERTETLQELQKQAGRRAGRWNSRAYVRQDGDADELLAVRQGDDSAVSSDAGTAGAVPRMLSAGPARCERLKFIPWKSEGGSKSSIGRAALELRPKAARRHRTMLITSTADLNGASARS